MAEDEDLSKEDKEEIARKQDIQRQRAALASQSRSYHNEMKQRQLQMAENSIGGLQREVGIFMLLVGASTAFLIYSVLGVSDSVSSKALTGWALKSYVLYPIYLVIKLALGMTKKTAKQ